jgi:hypothetical protein
MVLTRRSLTLLAGSVIFATSAVPVAAQRSGEAGPEDKSIAAALAGCYDVIAGEWSGAIGRGPKSAPVMLRLDTTVADTSGRIRFAAQVTRPPADPPPPQSRFPISWWPVARDSIMVVTWSNGYEAEVLFLRPEKDGFRGVARRTTDAIPVDEKGITRWDLWPWAALTATRIPCAG